MNNENLKNVLNQGETAGKKCCAPHVEIFTDGACSGNPGPGGWGAIVRIGEWVQEISGREPETTNNRMELTAVIEALKLLDEASQVVLTTDSKYVSDGIDKWIHNWKRNGWKTAARKPVKNQDMWIELDVLAQKQSIEWRWVSGHSGHPENERCAYSGNSDLRFRRKATRCSGRIRPAIPVDSDR